MDPLESRVAALEARVARLKLSRNYKLARMHYKDKHVPKTGKRHTSAVEYGLIAAMIAIAAITAMNGLGNQLKATFDSTQSAMAASQFDGGAGPPSGKP